MTSPTAAATGLGAGAYQTAYRPSAKGIFAVLVVHAALLALLASLDVVPMPPPLATLMVEVLPPAPPPEVLPQPTAVQSKPMPRPLPQVQAPKLAARTEAPAAAAEAPAVHETPPSMPAPASVSVAVSQPRFDADYLSNPAPVYPPLSRRLGEEGKVVLRVFVEPGGRSGQIEIKASSGSTRLDQAAQEAVSRWKFIPAMRGDEAVGAWVQVPIVFDLKG